jgi:hypothetical protein
MRHAPPADATSRRWSTSFVGHNPTHDHDGVVERKLSQRLALAGVAAIAGFAVQSHLTRSLHRARQGPRRTMRGPPP